MDASERKFWRAHHEAWKRSDLNQRQYCEAEGIPLKAFGNWRAIFKAEPQPSERKLLYRRRGLSHSLSHTISHTLGPSLSHVTYPSSSQPERPIVPRPREGHRRRFSEADKRRILEEVARTGISVSEVARRYGIDRRILCRWKQELSRPAFVAVEITDAAVSVDPPAAVYLYSPDRKAERPASHLATFSGILQVDGYPGFDQLGKGGTIRLAACWAHARRKFYEVQQATASPLAAEALKRIAELYAIETAM